MNHQLQGKLFAGTFYLIVSLIFTSSSAFPACKSTVQQRGRHTTRIRLSDDSHADTPGNSNDQLSRRNVFKRSIYTLGLALAASSANPASGNAIELGSNLLLSADAGVKGMPAPIKKSSGLGYKIRSVSKVMVR
jgi:hypothetical protein